MRRLIGWRLGLGVLGMLGGLALPAGDAPARPWTRDPRSLAADYLSIDDNRGGGEVVILVWMAPPMLPDMAGRAQVAEILDSYVVIGVVDARIDAATGQPSFAPVPPPQARTGDGRPLDGLGPGTMPPAVTNALVQLQSAMGRSLGPLGQGVRWFAFAAAGTRACAKGGLVVPFAGESYRWDTPVPGCP